MGRYRTRRSSEVVPASMQEVSRVRVVGELECWARLPRRTPGRDTSLAFHISEAPPCRRSIYDSLEMYVAQITSWSASVGS